MAEKIVIPVALLGLGTVGGGVYELFKRQKDEFFPKTGTLPMITHILVRDKKKPRPGWILPCSPTGGRTSSGILR